MKKILLFTILFLVTLFACCQKDPVIVEDAEDPVPSFDKTAMLQNWADNIIIPAHKAYNAQIAELHTQAEEFTEAPSAASLENLRASWLEAYKSWQRVHFFQVGKGRENEFEFYSNFYPLNTSRVDELLNSGNFELPSSTLNWDIHGFSALDYMLYGIRDNDTELIELYSTHPNAEIHRWYVLVITSNLKKLSEEIIRHWAYGFRGKFISNINEDSETLDYLSKVFYDFSINFIYDISWCKIVLPAGLCGSDCPIRPEILEAPYRGNISKTLLLEALNTAQDFYNGVPFNGSFADRKVSLYDYLDFFDAQKDGEKLNDLVNKEFDLTRTELEKLSEDFSWEIKNRYGLLQSINRQLRKNIDVIYEMRWALDMEPCCITDDSWDIENCYLDRPRNYW